MHRCRWLHFQAQKGQKGIAYRPFIKAEKETVAYCWQRGKTFRQTECLRCLLARVVTVQSSVFNALDHKQPMSKASWELRHGSR